MPEMENLFDKKYSALLFHSENIR